MPMNRRDLLKGITLGASGAMLSPIVAHAKALATNKTERPMRVVFVVESNGFTPGQAAPVGFERKTREQRPLNGNEKLIDFSLKDQKLPPALEPLAPWQDKVTILQGLSGKVCGGGHSNNFQALGAYGGGRGNGGESSNITDETIDGALAKQLRSIFPHLGLGISKRLENNVIYNVSAWAPNKGLPTVCLPSTAYSMLFGSVAGGKAKQEFVARNNLLDFIKDDVKVAQRDLSGQAREQFEAYLETFETLRDRQSRLNEIEDTLRAKGPVADDKYTSKIETDRLDAQFDIGTAALVCGLTNVMTLSSAAGIRDFDICFTGLGLTKGKHHTGHGGSQNGMDWYEVSQMVRRFHLTLIARMAKKLEAVPEGDGTMLDNTLIIYLSDGAEAHHSRCWEWPFVMLGDLGGRIKAGRYLDYPGYGYKGHKTTGNFYTTLLQLAGSKRETFGVLDPNLQDIDIHGPLTELLA